ncbi:scavenger receptor class F member 2-like isoform X2 [Magallana gigas]|uniref:scavenger receptor class F member 2-like isoform X2 n=1 Tax=Magallana gigas TaxID=29159 RepID=UPI0033405CD8
MAPTKRIILKIILCGATVAALNETSVGICNVKDNEINCCPNYHEVDNNCVVCPAGRWGDNCSLVCPINYYGVLCKEACDCHLEEKCDFKHGCISVLVLAALLIIVCFVICVPARCIKRHKARNLNEYLHVYPSHSLGKKTTGFSETIQDNYTQLKKETFTL